MKKAWMKWVMAVAMIATLVPMTGLAHGRDHRGDYRRDYRRDSIDERQREQERRIREGLRSGELTRREARRLEAEQFRIRADEERARRSDGGLDPRERARIQRELDYSSRDIHREKNDRQVRFR